MAAGASVGNIVLDTIADRIESNINATEGISGSELAEAIKALTEACAGDPDLAVEQRTEALELVEFLSEEAAKAPDERRRSPLLATLGRLGVILALAAQASEVWQQVGPVIEQALRVAHP